MLNNLIGFFLGKSHHKKRSPRVQLKQLDKISFTMREPMTIEKLPIANISSTGIGLLRKDQNNWPKVNTLVKGELFLHEHRYSIGLRIKRIGKEVVGCKIEESSEAMGSFLQTYFEKEMLAQKMVEVKPASLDPVAQGTPFCYFGGNGTELYIIVNSAGRVAYFQLSFCGIYVDAGDSQPLRLGLILKDNSKHETSNVIKWKTPIPEQEREFARRFISNMEILRPNYAKDILAYLE